MTKYSIPIEFVINAANSTEAEEFLEDFIKFTFKSYANKFNIDDWQVIGETLPIDIIGENCA